MKPVLRHAGTAPPGSGQAGLSLVDVMVAMVIMMLALVGLAAVIPMATSASQQGWQQSAAVAVAEEVLECMRAQTYTTTTDNITAANFPNNGPDVCGVSPPPRYTYTVTISNDTPITSTKTVTVSVTYQPMVSSATTVSFSAIFAASGT
jgi:Tfp pilus assembly protein PilV